jgi:hypothetical protein
MTAAGRGDLSRFLFPIDTEKRPRAGKKCYLFTGKNCHLFREKVSSFREKLSSFREKVSSF